MGETDANAIDDLKHEMARALKDRIVTLGTKASREDVPSGNVYAHEQLLGYLSVATEFLKVDNG